MRGDAGDTDWPMDWPTGGPPRSATAFLLRASGPPALGGEDAYMALIIVGRGQEKVMLIVVHLVHLGQRPGRPRPAAAERPERERGQAAGTAWSCLALRPDRVLASRPGDIPKPRPRPAPRGTAARSSIFEADFLPAFWG